MHCIVITFLTNATKTNTTPIKRQHLLIDRKDKPNYHQNCKGKKLMKILEVDNLIKIYPAFKLDSVSFSVDEGTIMGFIGRNGAGKTTTLKSILNLVHPDSGKIKLFGRAFDGSEASVLERIGYATGSNIFYQRNTLKDISQITKRFYSNWSDEEHAKYMKLFELDERKKLKDLSEGMKVKYSLALALSHNAELLILDEPTSGLDPISRDELLMIFKYLKSNGTTILFSTHITSDLEKCADSITYIKKGKIVKTLPLEEFTSSYKMASLEEIMLSEERNKSFNIEG